MIRQPDAYFIAYQDGTTRLVTGQSFERLVRANHVVGFWRIWNRKGGE